MYILYLFYFLCEVANESLELQSKSEQVERSARTELAEKAQQVKVLQQKLMMQEQRLEERTKQVKSSSLADPFLSQIFYFMVFIFIFILFLFSSPFFILFIYF